MFHHFYKDKKPFSLNKSKTLLSHFWHKYLKSSLAKLLMKDLEIGNYQLNLSILKLKFFLICLV